MKRGGSSKKRRGLKKSLTIKSKFGLEVGMKENREEKNRESAQMMKLSVCE